MTKGASASAVAHIEGHLSDNLSLDDIAQAAHYSKYHLHRRFAREAGMTVSSYICRRRLTEAAKMLVFTDRSVIDIATTVGFGSQQAFSSAFKRMFKKTPCQYRADEEFWPLQAKLELSCAPGKSGDRVVRFATPADEEEWMSLLEQVVDGYPHLDEDDYERCLRRAIARSEALVCTMSGRIVGALAFNRESGTIDFLGILPPFRGHGISKVLLRTALDELSWGIEVVSTTTFREGDPADVGWRAELLGLGFAEGELLTEFGYPSQRLFISADALKEACDAE